jgi:hypothetical protein
MAGWRKIVSGLRIDAKTGGNTIYLPATSGGSRLKRVMYVVKRIDGNATTDDIDLVIQHSPDGNLFVQHTAGPGLADIGTLASFESSAAVVLGEFFRAAITTASSTTQWYVVDVFEVTRAF